ncbi:MAG TPA: hypothetical protein VEL76_29070, partial [Gemmataceae bacterium]|nr:hypothetical protein [Gemmataceae bacterium]
MMTWRTLGSLIATLAVTAAAQAQTYPLKADPLVGAHAEVKIAMTLTGEMKVQQEGKEGKLEVIALKESATAEHAYVERILQAGADGTADRSARYYKTARVVIAVGDGKSERSLREDRRFLIAQRIKDAVVTYCPVGTLTREELQLTEHFDTLAVAGLLPGRAVAVGETWKLANPVAQALCHFDGLTAQELVGKLEQVKDDVATITVNGTAAGIDLGATVAVTVTASARFDLKAKRLTGLEWKQSDERKQGPASPESTVAITYTLSWTPIEPGSVPEVGDIRL